MCDGLKLKSSKQHTPRDQKTDLVETGGQASSIEHESSTAAAETALLCWGDLPSWPARSDSRDLAAKSNDRYPKWCSLATYTRCPLCVGAYIVPGSDVQRCPGRKRTSPSVCMGMPRHVLRGCTTLPDYRKTASGISTYMARQVSQTFFILARSPLPTAKG